MSRRGAFEALSRAAALSGGARAFFAGAWLLSPVVSGLLHSLGTSRLLTLLTDVPSFGARAGVGPDAVDVVQGERLVRAAFARQLLPVPRGCLPESITQYLLHSIGGPEPKLVIGVRRNGLGERLAARSPDALDWTLAAHAWVEADAGPARSAEFAPILSVSRRGGFWRAGGELA